MSFGDAYAAIREKEGRHYPAPILRKLPDLPPQHPLYREWQRRKSSLTRLMGHLRSMDRPLKILDLGCGVGWMSHHLSYLPNSKITAVERVPSEMELARKVFANRTNLEFRALDIFNESPGKVDIVVMGASVQYFPDLGALVARLRSLLKEKGQIHILDSPFYPAKEIPAAKKRSAAYYEQMGFPQLAQFYFHHSIAEIEGLGGQLMYNPNEWKARLRRRFFKNLDSPFPWYLLPYQSLPQ